MTDQVLKEYVTMTGPTKWQLDNALFNRVPRPQEVFFRYLPAEDPKPNEPADNSVAIKVVVTGVQPIDDSGEYWNVEGIAWLVPRPGYRLTESGKEPRRVHIRHDTRGIPGSLKFLTP